MSVTKKTEAIRDITRLQLYNQE